MFRIREALPRSNVHQLPVILRTEKLLGLTTSEAVQATCVLLDQTRNNKKKKKKGPAGSTAPKNSEQIKHRYQPTPLTRSFSGGTSLRSTRLLGQLAVFVKRGIHLLLHRTSSATTETNKQIRTHLMVEHTCTTICVPSWLFQPFWQAGQLFFALSCRLTTPTRIEFATVNNNLLKALQKPKWLLSFQTKRTEVANLRQREHLISSSPLLIIFNFNP